jgi:hypothetical protein
MAKQSSVNLDITNNVDGFDISGGTTSRTLSVTGGSVTLSGSGSATVTFPTTSTTIAGLGITQSFSALQSFSAGISAAGGVTLAGTLQGTTANFTGLVSSVVGFSGSGTNLKNIVTTFNGLSGAIQGVASVNGQTGAVTIASTDNVVISFNGVTGAIQGVSSVNGQTGAVTIASATNVVTSFNGLTGAVTGASLGANTFTALNTFNAGISAAGGATFSGSVTTDNILSSGFQLSLNDKADNRVAIGDYSGNGNFTYIYLRDNVNVMYLSNPYGDILIGDPSNIEGGYSIAYNSSAGYLDGGGSALTNWSTGSFSGLLTATAGISAGGTTAANFNGLVDMSFNTLFEPTLRYYNEVLASPTISANVLTLDLSTAQMFTVSLNANITTLTISNTPATANRSIGFTLIFTADGTARTVTWGAAVKWANNDPPALTSTNGKKDILSFVSPDGGTNWYGFIGGLNF